MIGRIEAIHERGEGSFVTDTTTLEATSGTSPRRSGALTAMRLAELQGLASSMGISGTAKMRKGDLVAAIKARQNGESGPASTGEPRRAPPRARPHQRREDRGTPSTEPRARSRQPRGAAERARSTQQRDTARRERRARQDAAEDRQERTDADRQERADGADTAAEP